MKGSQIIASQGRPSNNRSWPSSTPTEYGDGLSQDNIRSDGTDYIGKSFEEHISGYPVIVDGINSSPMLLEVAKSMSETLMAFENNINDQIDRAFTDYADFDRELGKSVMGIGQGVMEMGERVQILEQQDFDMAKSMSIMPAHNQAVRDTVYLSKSNFEPNQGGQYDKQEILDAMVKAQMSGDVSISQHDVLKFDSTGILGDHVKKSLNIQ